MRERWRGFAALAIGATILTGGVIGVSAQGNGARAASRPAALADSAKDWAMELVGLDEFESARPGTIDDGEELLPQASITLAEAIAAAQAAATGSLGEVDLETYRGVLVFNVDIGDQDVKINARTGEVLGMAKD